MAQAYLLTEYNNWLLANGYSPLVVPTGTTLQWQWLGARTTCADSGNNTSVKLQVDGGVCQTYEALTDIGGANNDPLVVFDCDGQFPTLDGYRFLLRVEDANGCWSSRPVCFDISGCETPCNSVINVSGVCTITATVTNCPSPVWQWKDQFGNNLTGAGNNTDTYTFNEDGIFYITATGCPNCAEVSRQVIVSCAPTVDCDNCPTRTLTITDCVLSATTCAGWTITYQTSINGSSGWTNISGNTVTQDQYYRAKYEKNGCSTLYSNIVLASGCEGTCNLGVSFTPKLSTVCEDDSISYDSTVTGATGTVNYSWKRDGLEVSTLADPVITFPNQGNIVVELDVTDDICTRSDSTVVTVQDCTTAGCECTLDPSLVYNDQLCQLSWEGCGDGWSVELQKGTVPIAGATSPYTPTSNGIYRLVFTKAGCVEFTTNAVEVDCASECPSISVFVSADDSVGEGADCTSYTASASGGTAPYTYLWTGTGSLGTVINQSGATFDPVTSLQVGESINVTVTATDANDCTGETTKLIQRCAITEPTLTGEVVVNKAECYCGAGCWSFTAYFNCGCDQAELGISLRYRVNGNAWVDTGVDLCQINDHHRCQETSFTNSVTSNFLPFWGVTDNNTNLLEVQLIDSSETVLQGFTASTTFAGTLCCTPLPEIEYSAPACDIEPVSNACSDADFNIDGGCNCLVGTIYTFTQSSGRTGSWSIRNIQENGWTVLIDSQNDAEVNILTTTGAENGAPPNCTGGITNCKFDLVWENHCGDEKIVTVALNEC